MVQESNLLMSLRTLWRGPLPSIRLTAYPIPSGLFPPSKFTNNKINKNDQKASRSVFVGGQGLEPLTSSNNNKLYEKETLT